MPLLPNYDTQEQDKLEVFLAINELCICCVITSAQLCFKKQVP